MKLEHFHTVHKNKFKWIKDLNVRPDNTKLLEKNTGRALWHKSQEDLFWPTSSSNEKQKFKNWDLIKQKLLHSRENHKQNKNTTLRIEENICKSSNWQINIQNIQTPP